MKRLLLGLLLSLRLAAVPLEEGADYLAAQQALDQQKFARARQMLEALLRENPDHYAALYSLGEVYRWGEGSLPRAYYCYTRAQKLLEKQQAKPATGPSWKIYANVLSARSGVAAQIERYQESLDLIDLYDANFNPKLTASKGFTYIKMGRIEQSRQLMLKLLDDPTFTHARGEILNTLGNIEFETDHLDKSLEYFQKIADEAASRNDFDPVYLSNAGEALRDNLNFQAAEQSLLKATERFSQYTYADPWGMLAELYAQQNRLPEALAALKKMQAWRISCSAHVSQNKWADCYAHVGSVLLHMGYDHKARKMLAKLVDRLDRNSGTSTASSLVEARLLYLYAMALERSLERNREKLSYCNWGEWPRVWRDVLQDESELGQIRRRVANLVAGGTGLPDFVLPFGARSLDKPSLVPNAWAFFGPGPALAASQGRTGERQPYLLAVAGEALAHSWNSASAGSTLLEALDKLPASEVKLRLRCQGVLAGWLQRKGKHSQALPYFQVLMQTDPSQLRACQLALPLSIETDGTSLALRARRYLYQSPRCRSAQASFVLKIETQGQNLQGQLSGPDGTQLASMRSETGVAGFCQAFHEEAFASLIDLTQADIHSIDGSTSVGKAKGLQNVLEP